MADWQWEFAIWWFRVDRSIDSMARYSGWIRPEATTRGEKGNRPSGGCRMPNCRKFNLTRAWFLLYSSFVRGALANKCLIKDQFK